LQKRFPECEISAKKEFKFAKGSTEQQQQHHAITIHFSTHLTNGWIAINSGCENKVYIIPSPPHAGNAIIIDSEEKT
jgi:hypothetical protein